MREPDMGSTKAGFTQLWVHFLADKATRDNSILGVAIVVAGKTIA